MLRAFGILSTALNKFAQSKNAVEVRNGKAFYSRSFIEDLANNYFMKQEAMQILGYKKSGLDYWMRSTGADFFSIGNVFFISREDVMRKVRG